MNMLGRVAITTAMLVPMVAAPVAAQNYRWDFGVNAGYSWYRAMLGSDETGLADGTNWDDVKFEAGTRVGAQLGYWLKPSMGLRANFGFTERPVVAWNYDLLDGDEKRDNLFSNVNLWSGSIDLLFRFKQPNEEWMGREVLPYLALGVGGKWHNPAGDPYTCVDPDEQKEWSCHPFTAGGVTAQPDSFGNGFALGEQKVLMGLVGLGADIRLAPRFALRIEANDRIYRPQVYQTDATIGAGNRLELTGQENADGSVSQIVHELGLDIGLHLLMGLARPAVVAVIPTPAPPVTVTPPPPPPVQPPAPREDAITVCVVDPSVPGGLRMQTAIFRYTESDTVVMSNGMRVPLRSSVGTVMTARNADWYVRGQPLTMTLGRDRLEYITEGGAVVIESSRLSYLGTVNGYPVYADRDEVADVNSALASLRAAEAGRDLGAILSERRDLRDEIEDVRFLYVPLESTGCVFQPLKMLEPVTKGK